MALSTGKREYGSVTHAAANAGSAVILASGSDGGVDGPSDIYEELALRLKARAITCIRLDYRELHKVDPCVVDVLTTIEDLTAKGINQVILVGWSFGGAVVVNAGAKSGHVAGVATIASHRNRAEAIAQLAPKQLLLIHGTADKVISVDHAHSLYAIAGQPKELALFAGADHYFKGHRAELIEKLLEWCCSFPRAMEGRRAKM